MNENLPISCTRCNYYAGFRNGSCLMNDFENLADDYFDKRKEDCQMREPFIYDYWAYNKEEEEG